MLDYFQSAGSSAGAVFQELCLIVVAFTVTAALFRVIPEWLATRPAALLARAQHSRAAAKTFVNQKKELGAVTKVPGSREATTEATLATVHPPRSSEPTVPKADKRADAAPALCSGTAGTADPDSVLEAALDDHHASEALLDDALDEHLSPTLPEAPATGGCGEVPNALPLRKQDASKVEERTDEMAAFAGLRGKLSGQSKQQAKDARQEATPSTPLDEAALINTVLEEVMEEDDVLNDCLAELAVREAHATD